MNICVLLYFELKNDVTIIVKLLHGATKHPGDLVMASGEKLTNHKHSNAQLCPDMFHNDP